MRSLVRFFDSSGIPNLEALKSWGEGTFADFEGKVRGLGPLVYQWLVMRLGRKTVKPDVHVVRFVARAIGRSVTEGEALAGLLRAADRLHIPANELDWSIWEFQRGRD